MKNFNNNIWFMKIALEEAEKAYRQGEVPVGCVIVDKDGNVVAKSHNRKEMDHDCTAHAEILAIKEASQKLGDWRLNGHTVYVTLEPCPMCLYALLHARVENVFFGAYDFKAGSVSLGYNFSTDNRFNHSFNLAGGVLHFDCSKILSNFFRERRQMYKS